MESKKKRNLTTDEKTMQFQPDHSQKIGNEQVNEAVKPLIKKPDDNCNNFFHGAKIITSAYALFLLANTRAYAVFVRCHRNLCIT